MREAEEALRDRGEPVTNFDRVAWEDEFFRNWKLRGRVDPGPPEKRAAVGVDNVICSAVNKDFYFTRSLRLNIYMM